MTIFFLKICIVREIKEKIEVITCGLNLDQKLGLGGARLEPGQHPGKPSFKSGPVLRFTHPVRFRATPKLGPDPTFTKRIDSIDSILDINLIILMN